MTFKLPFEAIEAQAFDLILQMVLAPAWEAHEYWESYITYITECGWTDQEFDQELLERIDNQWQFLVN